ncbi:MAG: hypothetical protein LBI56_02160 [Puniceicoccales bacterium]|nr:hypothetical protein [Puniceicoccales bacterium]
MINATNSAIQFPSHAVRCADGEEQMFFHGWKICCAALPKKLLQINFADLSDGEITGLALFFGNANGNSENLIPYRNRLLAIKDVYEFDSFYDFSS